LKCGPITNHNRCVFFFTRPGSPELRGGRCAAKARDGDARDANEHACGGVGGDDGSHAGDTDGGAREHNALGRAGPGKPAPRGGAVDANIPLKAMKFDGIATGSAPPSIKMHTHTTLFVRLTDKIQIQQTQAPDPITKPVVRAEQECL
jgi:hypothetical protein